MKIKTSVLSIRYLVFNIFLVIILYTLYSILYTNNQVSAQSPSPSPAPSASPVASTEPTVRETLRERVEEKLTTLVNRPRSLLGKITDIQDSSLLIETKNGIKQLKLNQEINIIDNREDKKKTLEIKNLQIGDSIAALGFTDTKDILDTRRILVVSETTIIKRAVYGIVQEKSAGKLTIKHPKKDETWTIKTDGKTKFSAKLDGKIGKVKFDDIEVGDRIISIGIPTKESNTLLTKLIHVIPGKAKGLLASPSPKPSSSPTPSPSPRPAPTP